MPLFLFVTSGSYQGVKTDVANRTVAAQTLGSPHWEAKEKQRKEKRTRKKEKQILSTNHLPQRTKSTSPKSAPSLIPCPPPIFFFSPQIPPFRVRYKRPTTVFAHQIDCVAVVAAATDKERTSDNAAGVNVVCKDEISPEFHPHFSPLLFPMRLIAFASSSCAKMKND